MTIKLQLLILFLLTSLFFPLTDVSAASATPTPRTTIEVPTDPPPSGVNMTLSPVFLNLSTDPGKEIVSSFKVTNNNTFREYVEIQVKQFESGPDGPVIQDVSAEDAFVTWVSFSEKQFILEPNQAKTIKFTISPPESASLGYYYAFSLYRMQPGGNEGVGASVQGAPALPVLLLVKSADAKRELQIVDFKPEKMVYEYLPATFTIRVKNSGNVHVAPAGDIFIDSMFNKEIAVLPANKARGNILPQSEREYSVSWDDGFAVRMPKMQDGKPVTNDKGETQYEVKYDFSKADKFRFGKYTANLLMIYDTGERDAPIEATVSFWVFPWKIVLIGVGITLFTLYGIFSVVFSNFRKIRRR